MGIVNYILYSLIINSNLYMVGNTTNLSHLDKMMLSIGETYPLYIENSSSSQEILSSRLWFDYLNEIQATKCLLLTNDVGGILEVIKTDGTSEIWAFEEQIKNGKASYVLQLSGNSVIPTAFNKEVNYRDYLAEMSDRLTKMDRLMEKKTGTKACTYFEKRLEIINNPQIEGRNIPTYGLNQDIQTLIYVYEISGDFHTYRGWNPFRLDERKEAELTSLYNEYQLFRSKMLMEVINSI